MDAEGNRMLQDWAEVERELSRRRAMRALLWQEGRARHPGAFDYSWLCQAHNVWKFRLSLTMRQSHVAGEKVFVDFVGDTIGAIDPGTAGVWQAHLRARGTPQRRTRRPHLQARAMAPEGDAALDGALNERETETASTKLAAAMQRIGELSMENELLRSRIE